MRFTAALIALALTAPAYAQDGTPQGHVGHVEQGHVETDTNLVCDTQRQVERFVELFDENKGSAEAAIAAVNVEQDSPDACVIATTAYRRGDRVATVKNAEATFDVVRVDVVGVYTLNGFERSRPT